MWISWGYYFSKLFTSSKVWFRPVSIIFKNKFAPQTSRNMINNLPISIKLLIVIMATFIQKFFLRRFFAEINILNSGFLKCKCTITLIKTNTKKYLPKLIWVEKCLVIKHYTQALNIGIPLRHSLSKEDILKTDISIKTALLVSALDRFHCNVDLPQK